MGRVGPCDRLGGMRHRLRAAARSEIWNCDGGIQRVEWDGGF